MFNTQEVKFPRMNQVEKAPITRHPDVIDENLDMWKHNLRERVTLMSNKVPVIIISSTKTQKYLKQALQNVPTFDLV